jgi:hypothetical protein
MDKVKSQSKSVKTKDNKTKASITPGGPPTGEEALPSKLPEHSKAKDENKRNSAIKTDKQ